MPERRLLSVRRRVAPDRRGEYDPLWGAAQRAVEDRGAHAWRFQSAADGDLFIEFIEYASDSDPLGDAAVARAFETLSQAFAAESRESWKTA